MMSRTDCLPLSVGLQNPTASTSKSAITKFSDLPLTQATLAGLDSSYFHKTTSIQSRSLPYTLKGYDILASARTGSGKTLAFITPLLERLYRAKWGPNDGLGALVISPTRELAVQIFEVLRRVGHEHSFSAGLVIGGKSLRDEQVCTVYKREEIFEKSYCHTHQVLRLSGTSIPYEHPHRHSRATTTAHGPNNLFRCVKPSNASS